MTPERWQQVDKLFQAAMERPADQRAGFLDEACADDPDLCREVQALVGAHEQAPSFLEDPAFEVPREVLTESQGKSMLGRVIGPYKITHKIGHGGMGTVYLAVRADDQYRKRVAIKLVKRGMNSDAIVRRFLNERQILASLDHPNIAKLLDGGTTEDGLPYFVMDYVEGLAIDAYCDTHKLSTVERLRLFRTVCSAVHYAHQNLVVHRDLKPSNILVTAEGVPKLLDFGIAKLLNPELSSQTMEPTGALRLMTPDYASPEQVRGGTITTASDVYSLGVLLYELLTGHRPYCIKSHAPQEIERVICEEEPEKPSTIVSRIEQIPSANGTTSITLTPELISKVRDGQPEKLRRSLAGDLDNIILMAMRKEPQRRYASAEQFSEDIRRHLENLPVVARKPTLAYRAAKFIGRHRAGVAGAMLVVLALVGGIITTTWQARVAQRAKARAERRFNDVRRLANSFLFEFHDAISNLPGTTRARQLVVNKALGYLNSLADEARGDTSLQRELVQAYLKVGDVQWDLFGASLGDSRGASVSYRKALEIVQQGLRVNPTDSDFRRLLALTYSKLAYSSGGEGDLASMHDLTHKAAEIFESLIAAQPDSVRARTDLAQSYLQLGLWSGYPFNPSGFDPVVSLDSYRKAQAIYQDLAVRHLADRRALLDLARTHGRIGEVLAMMGETNAGVESCRHALAILEQVPRSETMDVEVQHIQAFLLKRIGDLLAGNSTWLTQADAARQPTDVSAAVDHYREALRVLEILSAADPANARAKFNVAVTYSGLGTALEKAKSQALALDAHRKALAAFESYAATDPTNPEIQRDLSLTMLPVATLLIKIGNADAGRQLTIRALSLLKAVADRPDANPVTIQQYALTLLTCEPPELRSPVEAVGYAARAVQLTRQGNAIFLDTLALAYHETGDSARAVETEQKALALLPTPQSPNPHVGLRGEMDSNLARFQATVRHR